MWGMGLRGEFKSSEETNMYLGIPEGFVMNLRPKFIHICANHEFPKL